MLGKLLTPFTTAASYGVATRYLTVAVGAALSLLGILGYLTEDQVEAIRNEIPGIVTLLGSVGATVTALYAIFTKSSSDEAAEVAKEADKILAGDKKEATVSTPKEVPNLKIQATQR